MKITDISNEKQLWLDKGYEVFSYDREKMIEKTKAEPEWIHFGAGNLFRAFQAVFCDKLLDAGVLEKGIIAVGGRDSAAIDDYFRKFDNLHIAVTLKGNGDVTKRVVGSIAESLKIEDEERLKELFEKESLKVCSFTVTEKGYVVSENDTDEAFMAKVTALVHHRYLHGGYPLTLNSHDNCSHNGDVLKKAIVFFAKRYSDEGFMNYIEEKVSFPISMIDKITPRPNTKIAQILKDDGVEDLEGLDPNHYMSCFVNAEEAQYLVIEDKFANGRPAWEKGGIIFTDRETVDKVEKMKVGTCLNPVHTALAVYGCLLDHQLICDEMKDEELNKLARRVGYDEGLPVVVDPKILDPKEFIDTVINDRLPNPYMPDSPFRIVMDTSQKLPVRFGETLKAYLAKGEDISKLTYIPLVFAGWLRYLNGINDKGENFEIPSDPRLNEMKAILGDVKLGDSVTEEKILAILKDKTIFGVDLQETGLAKKVVAYLNEELKGVGAVRETLKKYL
ncbi:MAG: mannitol dehydrogenase family protein [Erysipelotrichaceae bacterium]|nr:mannitol dehydrogenase family protein [Erysipelotrichaceae bacterium]